MLHEQLLQQQLAGSQKEKESVYNTLPMHIISTLDNMAFGIAQKEGIDSFEVKTKMVNNINKLSPNDVEYLKKQMGELIHKSVEENQSITDDNVEKNFISFLIRLYY
jgi:hypothetical protein